MNLHFEISVPNAKVGISILKKIHNLTGVLPVNVTGYSPTEFNDTMKPIAEAACELQAEETTKYKHLRIMRPAI